MAKIETYPTAVPSASDMVIGTDASDSNETKNFPVSSLLALGTGAKGLFYSTVDQGLAMPNVAYPVVLGSADSDVTDGVSVVTNGTDLTRVTFAVDGTYTITFSAQLKNGGGAKHTALFWLAKNGELFADRIDNTTRKFTIEASNSFLAAHGHFMIKVVAGDFINLMWAGDSTNLSLDADAAGSYYPNIPSVILTVNRT